MNKKYTIHLHKDTRIYTFYLLYVIYVCYSYVNIKLTTVAAWWVKN